MVERLVRVPVSCSDLTDVHEMPNEHREVLERNEDWPWCSRQHRPAGQLKHESKGCPNFEEGT